MPENGRSESRTVGTVGAVVALVAVVGSVFAGWSWGSGDAITLTFGAIVTVCVVGWSLYKIESLTAGW